MKLTRRQTVVGAVGLAACGRTVTFELDDLIGPPEPVEDDPPMIAEISDMISQPGKPLYLTATGSVSSNSSGGVNAIALKNPMGLPMEILSMTWQISASYPTTLASEMPTHGLGGILACKLDLGQIQITNGFVPIWNFGKSEQLAAECIPFDGDSTGEVSTFSAEQYTWRLPRPLFVPAGGVVTPTFQHRGLVKPDLNVSIGYSARSMPMDYKPKKLCVPYAAAFVSKNFVAGDVTVFDTDQSTETDLVNPWNEPLYLQRFTGRAIASSQESISDTREGIFVLTDRALTVRMIDSHGRPVIYGGASQNGFVNFRTAFAAMTRSWEMDNGAQMEPNSYYNAFVRYTSLGAPDLPLTVQSFIGLVGWRELEG